MLMTALCLGQTARLQTGDEIRVVVVGYEPYSGQYMVLDDGSITGVGFGRVVAEGKTLDQLNKEITGKLAQRLKSPVVEVVMVKQRPSVVFVVGAAITEGPVPYVPGMDLRQLLGAVKFETAPSKLDVTLNRKGQSPVNVNLDGLLKNLPEVPNPDLRPNDVVVVLERANVRVWVTGMVAKPGETSVETGTDVYQAVAQAGGPMVAPASGTNGGITLDELRLVVRRGGQVVADLPAREDPSAVSPKLEPGDVVVVQSPGQVRVTVAGEVTAAGEYFLKEGANVTSAIAMAKGPNLEGTLKSVTVFRGSDAIQVDATQDGLRRAPFTLQAGDTVYVGRNERAVYALGEVTEPGKFLIPDNQQIDAAGLLARAKGLNSSGSLRRVVLIRPDADGKYVARQFNLDEFLKDGKTEANPQLMPGDILLFGTPKGITFGSVAQIASTALLFQTLLNRR